MKRKRFELIRIIKRSIKAIDDITKLRIEFEVEEDDGARIRVVYYKYEYAPNSLYNYGHFTIAYFPALNKRHVFTEFDCPLWILGKIVRKID